MTSFSYHKKSQFDWLRSVNNGFKNDQYRLLLTKRDVCKVKVIKRHPGCNIQGHHRKLCG